MEVSGSELVQSCAGDFDYDKHNHGQSYASQRSGDPRIAKWIHNALGSAHTVLNIGAGAGSYEPEDRHVIAIEPSASMRKQRRSSLAPAINGIAEQLPLDDKAVDAAMAIVTVHQWSNLNKGLSELRRVTRGPVVVLTFDPDALERFWLANYVPELIAVDRRRCPSIQSICKGLSGSTQVQIVPVPIDCVDGFTESFYARPDKFLDPAVRASQSAWSFIEATAIERFVKTLTDDLNSGTWEKKYGHWKKLPNFEGSLCLIVANPL